MNNILQILITTFKAKILPIFNKIRLWTSLEFLRTRLINNVRIFFSKVLDVKPRHKKDYYSVFNWLISKRLAFAIVIVTITVCIAFFINLPESICSKLLHLLFFQIGFLLKLHNDSRILFLSRGHGNIVSSVPPS